MTSSLAIGSFPRERFKQLGLEVPRQTQFLLAHPLVGWRAAKQPFINDG